MEADRKVLTYLHPYVNSAENPLQWKQEAASLYLSLPEKYSL